MNKFFKFCTIAIIFSVAYAVMPSSVEAIEISDKLKLSMDIVEHGLSRAN